MFDSEFFPTPHKIAAQMAAPYLPLIEAGEITSVLDPSAGKGDLLIPVLKLWDLPRIYAIEKVAELRGVLQSLETEPDHYRRRTEIPVHVLGDDVFEYQGRHVFDLILMNPPFSNGAEHLLKAWELLADGGRLACLLNEETIANCCSSERRRVADLIANYGTTEALGSVFATAERKTDVKVALVRLEKPTAPQKFNFGSADREKNSPPKFAAEDLENQIARRDIVGNAADAFDAATRALADLSKAWRCADHYLSLAGVNLSDLIPVDYKAKSHPDRINELIDAAQVDAWRSIIDRSDVERYFTARMRKDFDEFMKTQGRLDFNKVNILALFQTIFQSRQSIADTCVQDVFERMCRYDAKNKIEEGWKTNSSYKVNRRVILPSFIIYDGHFGFRLSYHRDYSELNDIDKALCHVAGRSYNAIITLNQALSETFKQHSDRLRLSTATSTFFECKFYKKGTLHLKFRDDKVWELFNIAAAQGKGWLGEAVP